MHSSQGDGISVPTADDEAYNDTEYADYLFDNNPVKPHQSPLGQHRQQNAGYKGTNCSTSEDGLVQDTSKNIGGIEQVWITGDQCRDVENQGAEASSKPGYGAEEVS